MSVHKRLIFTIPGDPASDWAILLLEVKVRLAWVTVKRAGDIVRSFPTVGQTSLIQDLVPRSLNLLPHDLSVRNMGTGIPRLERHRLISQRNHVGREEIPQRSARISGWAWAGVVALKLKSYNSQELWPAQSGLVRTGTGPDESGQW